MLPSRYWQELTSEDFARADAGSVVAVLPVGAVEQHGPHLPLGVDALINQGLLDRAISLLPREFPLLVLPAMAVGKSDEHVNFPGTLSLDANTLASVWMEVAAGVARAGVRKMVIFNSHGGQPQVMNIVTRALRMRHAMLAAGVTWFDLGLPDGLFGAYELEHGIHGGELETSVMLHLYPELVDMTRAANFASLSEEMADEFVHLRPEGRASFGWLAEDLNPHGVCGNAAAADAQRGKAVVEHVAAALATVLEDVRAFSLERLVQR